ncbi:MAG: hypothetical protein E7420_00900 [Ruminococcaceae bacterium]|nr:hypothetical protein [Oscillospiraceae bacterium]
MKKKNIFLRSLIIYCLVLIVIIGAGLFVLNRFLVSYEASRPDNAMEDFMAAREHSFWIDGLNKLVADGFNEFTKADAALSDFGIDENAEISWSSLPDEGDMKQFVVRLGSSRICTLSFVAGEDVGFGLNDWRFADWEFYMPGGSDISISAPTGSTVHINGVQVDKSYISGLADMDVSLEHSFDIAPEAELYEIKDMMGPAEIKAFDTNGVELNAQAVSAHEVAFLPEPVGSFSFCALPDSQIYINGTEISDEYCSPVDLGLDTGDNSVMLYECSRLYSDCSIRVVHDGQEVYPIANALGMCYIPGASYTVEGELAEFIEGFIYAYVDFSADKNDSARANFAALSKYLLKDSEFYKLTADTIENIAWATTKGLQYNSIDYYDLIPLGNDKYVCSISYDISYTLGSDDLNVKSGNLIFIEKIDGQYYVSAMGAALQ